MAIANVIKSLRVKQGNSFSNPSLFGVEQCFVGPMRGQGVNNLEEQLLLGPEVITSSWTDDDGVRRTTQEYRSINQETRYYKLEVYDYSRVPASYQYIETQEGEEGVDEDSLPKTLVIEDRDLIPEEAITEESLSFISDNYKHNIPDILLINAKEVLTEKKVLSYINDAGETILVGESRKAYVFNEVDNKIITRQYVINYLKDN